MSSLSDTRRKLLRSIKRGEITRKKAEALFDAQHARNIDWITENIRPHVGLFLSDAKL